MAQLMIVLDASVVVVALPSAQRTLHISLANRQWVLSAYALAFGSLLLLGGRIADYSAAAGCSSSGCWASAPRRRWEASHRIPRCSSARVHCRVRSPQ
ncbi:MAG TPA: hypothetical protein VNF07_02615 [Acidimicrobiales bacterium]|nr:hypothetical protein [Acidimicrobiales bacterium]